MVWYNSPKLEQSLNKARDKNAAKLLRIYMSDLSEDYHCAGWLVGLEYDLWAATKGDNAPGFEKMPKDEIDELKRLSEESGGWWIWSESDGGGEEFVTLKEWEELYENNPYSQG